MTQVLLCDDDEGNRLTTSALLGDEGFEVDLASSFAEGEAKITAENAGYALLILDQHLGDGLGSTLATIARARLSEARVLLLTGADQVEASVADCVLKKGQGFDALLEAVHAVLGSSRLESQAPGERVTAP